MQPIITLNSYKAAQTFELACLKSELIAQKWFIVFFKGGHLSTIIISGRFFHVPAYMAPNYSYSN